MSSIAMLSYTGLAKDDTLRAIVVQITLSLTQTFVPLSRVQYIIACLILSSISTRHFIKSIINLLPSPHVAYTTLLFLSINR